MIKTLAYLVVCMTCGAATLSWFEPEPAISVTPSYKPAPVLAQVVDVSAGLIASQWKEIRIHHDTDLPAGQSGPIALQANRPEPGYHFVIFPDGSLEASQAWRSQRPADNGPDIITVGVTGSPDSTKMPSRQWKTLMRLVQELQARCGIPPGRIRLDPTSDPTKCPNLPSQALDLHLLLSSVGLGN